MTLSNSWPSSTTTCWTGLASQLELGRGFALEDKDWAD